ncbi:hypothetical protein DIURU_000537 [Diutina rugosa]|uniref:Small-subunit processome Utp12 domain-containing protein n=1 Tax=Diutina rugosa TaxID=5481 RepID=A0A642UXS6_DIURU|nr:uncharacterized protein DIURU_000537 [Diutina rugosa]KAA8907375.1 hypothetical protein DIURU_000537 [Diutina rugosa]
MTVICSRFDPTRTLLATVEVALDAHHLRVQSVVASQSSVSASLAFDRHTKATSTSWIPYKNEFVVAVGTAKGAVQLFSPTHNRVELQLATPSGLAVSDFYFCDYTQRGYCADVGGNIYEYNVNTAKLVSQFKVADVLPTPEPIKRIGSVSVSGKAYLLLASHSVYMVSADDHTLTKTFPGHVEPIECLVSVSEDVFVTSAHGDRFINVYSVVKGGTSQVLVASRPVADFALGDSDGRSVLVARGDDGTLDVFNDWAASGETSVQQKPNKKRRRGGPVVPSKQSSAHFKVVRPPQQVSSPADADLAIIAATVDGSQILYSWMESATIPHFNRVKWFDNDSYSMDGEVEFSQSKPTTKSIDHHNNQGHDIAATKHYTEANTIISDGNNLRDLDNVSDDDEGESLAEKLEKLHPNTTTSKAKPAAKMGGKNAATLSIVLSQSLRNNDHSLLEVVLGNRDPEVIKNTIAKLDSSLAVTLLDRLSERIQRQATKFDQLNFWLKWIIIIHGAVLASMPNLAVKLSSLHAVLIKKADTMPRLLELQGRLTLLYHQQGLKREILTSQDDDVLGDASDVEYIEALEDGEGSDYDMDEEEEDDFEDGEGGIADIELEDEDIEADDVEEEEMGFSDVEADA